MMGEAGNGSRYRVGAAIPLQPSPAADGTFRRSTSTPPPKGTRLAAQMDLARDYDQAGA
jgi:hypothetical protein